MADTEIEINGKKFSEGTQITLTAKNLIIIIGILVSGISTLATIGYFDIKSDIKKQKEIFDTEKVTYIITVEDKVGNMLKEDREKREMIIETIGEMKGDIKVILDRTSRNNDHNGNGNVTPIPNSLNIPIRIDTTRNRNTINNGINLNN